jgi:hypothetical protein
MEDFFEDEKVLQFGDCLFVSRGPCLSVPSCAAACAATAAISDPTRPIAKDYPRNRITPSDRRISEGEITSTERQPDIASFVGWCILNSKKRRPFCVPRCSFYVLASSPKQPRRITSMIPDNDVNHRHLIDIIGGESTAGLPRFSLTEDHSCKGEEPDKSNRCDSHSVPCRRPRLTAEDVTMPHSYPASRPQIARSSSKFL